MKEKNLTAYAALAIRDYCMIEKGDRVLVGMSGGMDSMALLLVLHSLLSKKDPRFSLHPVLIDNFNGENAPYNGKIRTLADFIRDKTGLELTVIPVDSMWRLTLPEQKKRDVCYLCASRRRAELFRYAEKNGCRRIALGHHKDDIVETSLMNMLYKRELSSMLPRLPLFGGQMDIIRPLAYVNKARIEAFIWEREEEVPVFGEVCPSKVNRKDHRREEVRKMLSELGKEVPKIRDNVFAAFRNPKPDYLLDFMFQKGKEEEADENLHGACQEPS